MHHGYPHVPAVYGSYGYTPINTTYAAQFGEVEEQVRLAETGKLIENYRQANTSGSLTNPPTSVASAHLRIAYWFAVAVRLGYPQFLATAKEALRLAKIGLNREVDASVEGRVKLMKNAWYQIASSGYASKGQKLAPVANFLYNMTDKENLKQFDQIKYEQSTRGIIEGTARKTGEDLKRIVVDPVAAVFSGGVDFLELISSFFTGKIPPKWQKRKKTWWAMRIAFFGIPSYLLYATYVRPITGAIFKRRAPAIETKAESATPAPSTNPRRRRKS